MNKINNSKIIIIIIKNNNKGTFSNIQRIKIKIIGKKMTLNYSKNFNFFIQNKSEITFKELKFDFEVRENKVITTTLFISYIYEMEEMNQLILFHGDDIKVKLVDHLFTFFDNIEMDTSYLSMAKVESFLTFIEILFKNILNNEYNINDGKFYFNIKLPLQEYLCELFLFEGIINNKEYIFEKQNISFNEYDIFYPGFLINDNSYKLNEIVNNL